MKIMINGIALEGDFMDADFVGPYEEATNRLAERAKECQNKHYSSFAESILEQCASVDDYFDEIFGDGTAAKIFEGNERQLMVHLKAVEDLTNWAQGEKKKLSDFTNKYTQRQNAERNRQRFENQKKANNLGKNYGGTH